MLNKFFSFVMVLFLAASVIAAEDYWVKPMQDVHKKFTGLKGSVRLCGDSITEDSNFWSTIPAVNSTADFDYKNARDYVEPDSWCINGPAFGNKKGWTVKNGMGVLDVLILKRQNPEVCIVKFGANDLRLGGPAKTGYDKEMRIFIDKILNNGTIAIMSTIAPIRDKVKEVGEYNIEIKKIALEKKVPLIEFYEEVMKRQPEKWDAELLSDGTHLNWNKEFSGFDEESLKKNGNMVRNYVTFKKYAEVYEKVLKK
ncbi:MAG: SGNH/GDSL hydrolase family protein [Candidatus Firestonebacteria bacterium]